MAARLVTPLEQPTITSVKIRVIYADTDRMGVVYHGTYLRYLEHARVEYIRSLGFAYADMERLGYGLPVTDIALSYLAPARYDDIVSVHVALTKLTAARVYFGYRLTIEPGDRHEFAGPEPIELIRAESRHGCVSLDDGGAARIPDHIHDLLASGLPLS
ncbi:acyl-CoA thioesterase [Nannocystaceae bacterium ST9]